MMNNKQDDTELVTEKTWRLGILASHSGSNFQAIIDAISKKSLNAVIAVLISNNPSSFSIERAKTANIAFEIINSKTHEDFKQRDQAICNTLLKHSVDLVVLAGYMKQLGQTTLSCFKNRVINIHPALLPKHGGKGMFGLNVHESVIRSGDKITGATVHLVTENYDEGKILAQCTVKVAPEDTAETLANKVITEEHKLLVNTIQRIINKEISLN